MYKTYTTKVYRDIDIFINKTVFLNKDETINIPLNDTGLTVEKYDRRHYITSGKFKFNGINLKRNASMSPRIGELGRIFPDIDDLKINEFKLIDSFDLIPVEDNSCYLCIRTCLPNNIIKHENYSVNIENEFTLLKGNLYIANINLIIDGVLIEAHTPIPVIKSDRNINIKENGRITQFYSTGINNVSTK